MIELLGKLINRQHLSEEHYLLLDSILVLLEELSYCDELSFLIWADKTELLRMLVTSTPCREKLWPDIFRVISNLIHLDPAAHTSNNQDQRRFDIKVMFQYQLLECEQFFATLIELMGSVNHEIVFEALACIKIILAIALDVLPNIDPKQKALAERMHNVVLLNTYLHKHLQSKVFGRNLSQSVQH